MTAQVSSAGQFVELVQRNVEAHIAQAAYWARQLHEEVNGVDLQASVVSGDVETYDVVLKRGSQPLGGFGK